MVIFHLLLKGGVLPRRNKGACYMMAVVAFQYVQMQDPKYQYAKESTAWSMDKFNEYVNEHIAPVKKLENHWVYKTLTVSAHRMWWPNSSSAGSHVEGRELKSWLSQTNDLQNLPLSLPSLVLGINRIGQGLVSTVSG